MKVRCGARELTWDINGVVKAVQDVYDTYEDILGLTTGMAVLVDGIAASMDTEVGNDAVVQFVNVGETRDKG